jgi:glyoxylase-like metal-dependent hydrolase (beta-lactamase superfamily II)
MNEIGKPACSTADVAVFFERRSSSLQYVVADARTQRCAIIDPVLDFDPKSGCVATHSADAILADIAGRGLTVDWILDTHPHADHFSAAAYLRERTGAPTAIGAHVVEVQKLWSRLYNLPELSNATCWDRLFEDGDCFSIGSLEARVLHSPGHTLASIAYLVGDAAFIHDTLFMPDSGTARADFPGGSAAQLWDSIERILALPDETRLFTGHDYQPNAREVLWESTVAEQKRGNPHIAGKTKQTFVDLREERDRGLPIPQLMLQALQVILRGGRLPEPEADGRRYLKLPLDAFPGARW